MEDNLEKEFDSRHQTIDVARLYQETLDDLKSVLNGRKYLYEVFHYEERDGRQNKIQHQSIFIESDIDDSDKYIWGKVISQNPPNNSLTIRKFTNSEVALILSRLQNELGIK
jgi:hypothetical protein